MAINLNGVGTQPSLTTKNERVSKDEANASSNASTSSVDSKETLAEDTVQLSSVAQSLQSKGSDSESSAIDMDKVEQIKQAIAAGEYKIDTEKLAGNMMSMDALFS
ncbi:flagellar biosynthesis anti-sigma factor FlgM [Rhodanobacter aciditrophus]|uniref:Negative regulator of flagellin synthesis n=1 Tax=Rhodanobacter aciditrophus TaxID=1623218 RepID=A0ABW4B2H3_9GAMM